MNATTNVSALDNTANGQNLCITNVIDIAYTCARNRSVIDYEKGIVRDLVSSIVYIQVLVGTFIPNCAVWKIKVGLMDLH